ncbi:MAG: hypothetical protein WBK91_11000 [Alphaproteobacteria bacterium]
MMANGVIQQGGSTLAYEPFSEIRNLIGEDVVLKDVFTEDRIQACARLIDQAKNTFFEITNTELNMLAQLAAAPVIQEDESKSFIAGIVARADNIKGQAEILGFTLIARICMQISAVCHASRQRYDVKLLLITRMVDTLRLAYKQKITDEGGVIGKEILAQLDRILGK